MLVYNRKGTVEKTGDVQFVLDTDASEFSIHDPDDTGKGRKYVETLAIVKDDDNVEDSTTVRWTGVPRNLYADPADVKGVERLEVEPPSIRAILGRASKSNETDETDDGGPDLIRMMAETGDVDATAEAIASARGVNRPAKRDRTMAKALVASRS